LHRSDAASLKATVKATPVDADGQGNTNELIGLALRIQNNPGWTSVDVLHRKLVELQNRWSASLAMSTTDRSRRAPPFRAAHLPSAMRFTSRSAGDASRLASDQHA
jgi:hypothetical protein